MCVDILVCTDKTCLCLSVHLYSLKRWLIGLSFLLKCAEWRKTVAWRDSLAPEFLLEHRRLSSSLSSSITPSFFPLALMNSAQQKCPVEELLGLLFRVSFIEIGGMVIFIIEGIYAANNEIKVWYQLAN